MRIAYLEDIPEHREQITREITDWLERNAPASTVTVFPDADSFLFALEDNPFDLLLLDILMPGMDGMTLAEVLRERGDESMIVFITGEKDFVFDGYKVAAMDYLLKPIHRDELDRVLTRALRTFEETVPVVVLDTERGLESVRLDKIAAIEVRDKDLIFTIEDKGNQFVQQTIRGSLGEWIDKIRDLGAAEDFLHIHRSYVCHAGYVKRLEDDTVELRDGSRLPLARSRKKDIMRRYLAYRKTMARAKTERGGR